MKGPKLRKLERYPIERDGEKLLVLQDPHQLDAPLAVDPCLEEYLDMMDGKRSVAQLRQSLILRGRPALPLDELQAVVDTLEACGFLDDDNFRRRWAQCLREFSEAPRLQPELAALAYPENAEQLQLEFEALCKVSPLSDCANAQASAIIWPYSPYPFHQENPEAAELLHRLPDPAEIEGILLLASSHHDGATPYQLLRKDYQTLLGPLAHPTEIATALSTPRPWLLQEPLRWRAEQSIESSLLALRARYGDRCPPILSILCGRACFALSQDPEQTMQSASLLAELENLVEQRPWLILASAQLGHLPGQSASALDTQLLNALKNKDERAFFPSTLRKVPSQERPIGGPVLSTLLSLMPKGWRCNFARLRREANIDGAGSVGHAYLCYSRH